MKKILAIFLCLLMLFCFAACDSDSGGKGNSGGGGGGNDAAKTTEATSAAVKFYVNVGTVRIELGADADSILAALGTPKSSEDKGNCGGQGTLTKYVYASMDIVTIERKNPCPSGRDLCLTT